MLSDPQFWVAIAFIIFIIAIFNPVKKILTTSLDKKIEDIRTSIDEAESLKNETQDIFSNIKKQENKVGEDIEKIHSNANERIKIIENEVIKKLDDQILKRELQAKIKIEQITRDANTEIQNRISSTAINATINLIKNKLNENEKENLIEQSIKELDSIIKN